MPQINAGNPGDGVNHLTPGDFQQFLAMCHGDCPPLFRINAVGLAKLLQLNRSGILIEPTPVGSYKLFVIR